MLAPRALHFTNTQIFWDCPTHSACESLPGGLPRELDHGASVDRNWRAHLQQPLAGSISAGIETETTSGSAMTSHHTIPYEFWKIAVARYTACALSFHSDKLKALWGIAKLVQDSRGGEAFLAGLWERDLVLQLAWTVEDPVVSERPELDEKNWFPSWSWASVTGKVEVVDREIRNKIYTASVNDGQEAVTAKSDGDLPQMAKAEASLKLQGYRAKATMSKNDDGPGWIVKIPDAQQTSVTMTAFPDIFPSQKNGLLDACEVFVLAVGERRLGLRKDGAMISNPRSMRRVYSGTGLLIKECEHAQGSGEFRRLGAIKFGEITRQSWEGLCHACGQTNGELPEGNGGILSLV